MKTRQRERERDFVFRGIFCPFTSLETPHLKGNETLRIGFRTTKKKKSTRAMTRKERSMVEKHREEKRNNNNDDDNNKAEERDFDACDEDDELSRARLESVVVVVVPKERASEEEEEEEEACSCLDEEVEERNNSTSLSLEVGVENDDDDEEDPLEYVSREFTSKKVGGIEIVDYGKINAKIEELIANTLNVFSDGKRSQYCSPLMVSIFGGLDDDRFGNRSWPGFEHDEGKFLEYVNERIDSVCEKCLVEEQKQQGGKAKAVKKISSRSDDNKSADVVMNTKSGRQQQLKPWLGV